MSYETDRLSVILSGPQMGALVIDPAGDRIRVGVAASQQRFEATFFRVLNARTRGY